MKTEEARGLPARLAAKPGAGKAGKKEGKFCFWFFVPRPSSCILLLFFLLHPSTAHADKIYLKDGKVYEGRLVGKSEKRFLFSVDMSGTSLEMSFFPENVEKIELGKETVESQIPYLKDVESTKVGTKERAEKTYELSLYKEPGRAPQVEVFTENELKLIFTKDEFEYYQKFNDILVRYTDKFSFIQNVYLNLTTATKEDFVRAKDYMDGLYFELNSLSAPDIFRRPHAAYLEAIKASYLSFDALAQGLLEEAAKQNRLSEDGKQGAMSAFRDAIFAKKSVAGNAARKAPGGDAP